MAKLNINQMERKMTKLIRKIEREIENLDLKLLVVSMFISFFVAYIGSTFTIIDSWYEAIKPSITPPSFVFPIVWTILFFLIGFAFYFSFKFFRKDEQTKLGALYSINFILNIAWSFFFFTMHNTLFAFGVIVLLVLSTFCLIFANWKKARIASYLFIPYLIWLFFAGILNIIIVINILK